MAIHEDQRAWKKSDNRPKQLASGPSSRRETLELMHGYYRISGPIIRGRLLKLAKALGRMSD